MERGVGNQGKREYRKDEKINATEKYIEKQNCKGRDKRYI